MRTINFYYDNGTWLSYTAAGTTKLATAVADARRNMPEGASKFRIVFHNGNKSAWLR